MARAPRLELPGVPLHVIQRGNNRAPCFVDDGDRRLYLKTLAEASARYVCHIHAYVLMPNHVHLLLTPSSQGAVSGMMQDLGRRYVRIFNEVHRRSGTLWEGRYKSHLIDTETYLLTCHRYIELNPVRAGLVDHAANFPWTSHRHYALGKPDPLITHHRAFIALADNESLRRQEFLSLFAIDIDSGTLDRIRASVNRGWALGSEKFLDQLEESLGRSARPPKRGRPLKNHEEEPRSTGSTEMLI